MVQSKLYYTTSARVNEIEVKNGQIIFVPDVDTVYLDMQNTRWMYSLIHTFPTDIERVELTTPLVGFYYVEENNTLWRWNNGWSRMTPRNLSPVVYGETENEFPVQGEEDTLYYTDNGIYNYKKQKGKYNLIANVSTWEEM